MRVVFPAFSLKNRLIPDTSIEIIVEEYGLFLAIDSLLENLALKEIKNGGHC
jgi:hypothetical protein